MGLLLQVGSSDGGVGEPTLLSTQSGCQQACASDGLGVLCCKGGTPARSTRPASVFGGQLTYAETQTIWCVEVATLLAI